MDIILEITLFSYEILTTKTFLQGFQFQTKKNQVRFKLSKSNMYLRKKGSSDTTRLDYYTQWKNTRISLYAILNEFQTVWSICNLKLFVITSTK